MLPPTGELILGRCDPLESVVPLKELRQFLSVRWMSLYEGLSIKWDPEPFRLEAEGDQLVEL
jgi:hypothetical protein